MKEMWEDGSPLVLTENQVLCGFFARPVVLGVYAHLMALIRVDTSKNAHEIIILAWRENVR